MRRIVHVPEGILLKAGRFKIKVMDTSKTRCKHLQSVVDVGGVRERNISSYIGREGDGYDSNFLLWRDVTGRVCVFYKKTRDAISVDGCRKVTVLLDCGLVGEDKVSRSFELGEGMKFFDGINHGGTPGLFRHCYTTVGAVDWEGMVRNGQFQFSLSSTIF